MSQPQRKGHISRAQKQKLLEIISNKPELRNGKFSDKFTFKHAQEEWKEISLTLNSIPGSVKNWKEWRKTWQDLVSKTKKKTADINRTRRGTGGGPPPDSLDEFEEGVSSLINPNSISGHQGVEESIVIFEDIAAIEDCFMDVTEVSIPPPLPFLDPVDIVPVVDTNQTADTQTQNRPSTTGNTSKRKINMKTVLKEKIELKKKLAEAKINFYDKYLDIQKQRNDILKDISNNLRRRKK